jgi:hypothetical protein
LTSPFALAGVGVTVATVVYGIGAALFWGSLLAAAVCAVLRFAASRGVQRQQLRWVATGAAAPVAGLAVAGFQLLPAASDVIGFSVILPSVPMAVAVLRAVGTWTTWSAPPSPTRWSPQRRDQGAGTGWFHAP